MKVSDKSLIAKLLAAENITVVQGNVKTASFDVKNRVLTIPLWVTNIESYVEDHMTGHEVGHALFTPLDGWHDAVCSKGMSYKSFLNVVEDARIEKLIQRKYPGFRPVFIKSYRKLFADGFFGSNIEEINRGSLIDRINTYFKCGGSYGIVFDESEQHWLQEISELETWEEVEELTDRLYGSAKESEKEREEQQKEEESQDSEEESQTLESDEFDDLFDEESDDGNISNERVGGESGEDFTPAASETDQELRENIDRNMTSNFDGKIENFSIYNYDKKWKEYVRPYKDLVAEIEGSIKYENYIDVNPEILKEVSTHLYQKWRKNNMKSVNNMVKEFEMRKSAANFSRGSVSKTGVLDTVKMNNYKMTDDIFKKVTIVPDGKNHGFIMYLDMSGSMSNIFHDTVCQTLLLVHFARQINVPFRVYGFSDAYRHEESRVGDNEENHPGIEKDTLFANTEVTLIELFSDKMNKRDMMKVSGALLCQNLSSYNANKFGYENIADHVKSCTTDWQVWNAVGVRSLRLGGTPLDASLLVGIYAARSFKKDYQIDVLNTIFLTDGSSHPCSLSTKNHTGELVLDWNQPDRHYTARKHTTIHFEGKSYLIDRKHNFSNRLHEIYQNATDSRTIGFYILPNGIGALRREYEFSGKYLPDEERTVYSKNGYNATQLPGIDQQFYVPEKSLRTVNNNMEEVSSSDSKAKVRSAFRKGASGSKKSRKMLVELAKAVA